MNKVIVVTGSAALVKQIWSNLIFRLFLVLLCLLGKQREGICQDKAIANIDQSLTNAIQQKDDKGALHYSLQLAEIKRSDKKYGRAIAYFTQSLTYSKRLTDYSSQYVAYTGLGLIHFDQKNYNKTRDAFEEGVKAARSARNKSFEAMGLIHLALAEEGAARYKKMTAPLEGALAVAVELNDEKMQLNCYYKLAENWAKLGSKEKSSSYKNLYVQMISSQQAKEITNQKVEQLKQQVTWVKAEKEFTELRLLNETQRLRNAEDSLREIEVIDKAKQMEIDLLNKNGELAEMKISEQHAQIENQRLWRNSIIGGSLLAAMLVAVIIYDYRKKLRVNKTLHHQSENIKGSINYAKRIQEAMLPKKDKLTNFASDSFVLFKPRDTVSGDFYWFSEIKNGTAGNDFAFAAVDCTGHGVPGAFMSMIGMNALNSMMGKGITKTDQILNSLHTEIRTALRQEESGNNDGMDVGLCIFRRQTNILEFSSAKNPLVYIQNNELFQVKGDIHPIGGSKSKPGITFKKHEIIIDKPTTVYLYSDGYRDQFGGKDNTKFMSKKFTRLLFENHQLPMEKQKELLSAAIEEWQGNNPQTDDILVMGLTLHPRPLS
jgi:serine phosphatase RsbU (regulator of sigma subunit)